MYVLLRGEHRKPLLGLLFLSLSHVYPTQWFCIRSQVEEFYTVRCQVADMKNLYESLDEVTVKDTLDGDNMYTCDKCGKKVRAEKRACFKNLPRIICFNTMRLVCGFASLVHFTFFSVSAQLWIKVISPDIRFYYYHSHSFPDIHSTC